MEEFLVDLNNEIYLQSASNGETTQDTFFEIISVPVVRIEQNQIFKFQKNTKIGNLFDIRRRRQLRQCSGQ